MKSVFKLAFTDENEMADFLMAIRMYMNKNYSPDHGPSLDECRASAVAAICREWLDRPAVDEPPKP